ncbi:hypothetical protein ONE63_000506 [Megalurothrips usitatus]|uniref:Uncharacterized protein n=1 Tax=Megalurothrips usitatus TaxID=439358 RepID=A0AAV7Y4Q5_9NEOP|nr:hypothetical protein ONE63_000506 [Megalurothrips usitatus]
MSRCLFGCTGSAAQLSSGNNAPVVATRGKGSAGLASPSFTLNLLLPVLALGVYLRNSVS